MTIVRLAWFSPFPPVQTGIAAVSAELVVELERRGFAIDRYPAQAAHDFPWRHRQRPYDLVVYQFGNSSHHDYEWAYALRYPGLVVLHDTHLHHARAAFLLRERRPADYRAEFIQNHPGVAADAAELGVAGFDSVLYYQWPMVRGLVEKARLVAVHGDATRRLMVESVSTPNSPTPDSQTTPNFQLPTPNFLVTEWAEKIVAVRLGHGRLVAADERADARRRVRAKHGIADDDVLFVCAGGITPEKRIGQVLAALRATLAHAPSARLLLAGGTAEHYDVRGDIAAHGLDGRVIVTGYLASDAELTDHLAAADVSLNLRWPTAGETSGPWLRALAAGVATVITDLAHLGDVPSLDPRTWTGNWLSALGSGLWEEATKDEATEGADSANSVGSVLEPKAQRPTPVSIAIDILDEDHSLRLAMRRLATDADLRDRLGRAGQEYWQREHSIERMVEDYQRVIHQACEARESSGMRETKETGEEKLEALLTPFGVHKPW